jgi:flagellar M-ring protein FliF
MKDRILELFELFKAARPATRITLVASTAVILVVAIGANWVASRPDLVQIWRGLSSAEAAEYKSALAQAGIPFRSSPPPENGIWVDSSKRMAAEAQVALGGYRPTTKGIQLTDGGIDSAFISARSRNQMAEKREWQECEMQLQHLSFVESATVCSSGAERGVFTSHEDPTISVTLGLRHGEVLDPTQARTVATLVRTRFNVPLENITIVDMRGNLIHDGSDSDGTLSGSDLFAQKRRHDSDTERRANRALEIALGKGMAHVTVNSVWKYDQTETIQESALPDQDPVALYSSTSESETSQARSLAGGPAGVSSNITQDFGNESAIPGQASSAGPLQTSSSSETRNLVGRSTQHTLSRTPSISRLSVALVTDESVAANLEQLEKMVKAAVGFDTERGDDFASYATPLASLQRDESGKIIPAEEPEPLAPPNEYLQLAVEHGVEVLAALAFIFVLLKSLRGAKRAAALGSAHATSGGPNDGDDDGDVFANLDPDLLARVQVEELVKSDPEKVSEILAQWASTSPENVGA